MIPDDRKEFVTNEKLPFAAEHGLIQYDAETGVEGKFPLKVSASLYVIVATWGWDEPALQTIASLNPQPEYVGLIGSRAKARVIKGRLLDGGSADEFVENIISPAGLDPGAETPGEMAL